MPRTRKRPTKKHGNWWKHPSSTVGSARVATFFNSRFMTPGLDYTEPWHRLLQRPHMGLRFLQYPYLHYYPIEHLPPFHAMFPITKRGWNYTFSSNRCINERGLDFMTRRFPMANSIEGPRTNRSNEFCSIVDSSSSPVESDVDELGLVEVKEEIKMDKTESEPLNFDADRALDQLDQHWPELKSSVKLQAKGRNYLKTNDGAPEVVHEEHVKCKENFPLWNTREIVTDSNDDATVLGEKDPKTNGMCNHLTGKAINGRANKNIQSQAHKTYADVVQQELGKPEWHVAMTSGMKFVLKFEKKTIEHSQLHESVEKDSDSIGNSSFEVYTNERLAEFYQEMDRDLKELLLLIGPQNDDLTTEWSTKKDREYFGNVNHHLAKEEPSLQERSLKQEYCEKYDIKESFPTLFNLEVNEEDTNIFANQDTEELLRAEDIVTHGLDLRTALTVALELWGGQKCRMPYTKIFYSDGQQMRQPAHHSKRYLDWKEMRQSNSNVWKLECL